MEGSNEVEIVREQRLDEDHQETQTTSLLLAPSTYDIFVDPKKFVDTKSESIVSTEIVQKIENERTYENDQISRESESEEISPPLNDESLGNRENIQFDDILEMESGDRLPDIIPDQTVVATVTLETTTSEQEMHQIPSPQLSPTDHRTLHFPRTATRDSRPDFDELASAALKDLEEREKTPETPPRTEEKKSILSAWSLYPGMTPRTPPKAKSPGLVKRSPTPMPNPVPENVAENQSNTVFMKVYSFLSSSISTIAGNSSLGNEMINSEKSDTASESGAPAETQIFRKEVAKVKDFREIPGGNPTWIASAHVIRFRGPTCSYDSYTPASHFQTASTESNIPFTLTGSLNNLKGILQRTPGGGGGGGTDMESPEEIADNILHSLNDSLSSICRLVQGNRDRQILVGKQGGCKLVLRALQNYADSVIIAESGLQLVYWLSLVDTNKQKLCQANAIDICLSVANHHSDIELIAELSCKALCCLAYTDQTRTAWVSSGSFKVLKTILITHSHSSLVVEWVCRSLYCLVNDHPLNREAAAGEDFCAALMASVFTSFPHNDPTSELLKWSCRAIGNLAFQCLTWKQLLGEAGACEIAVGILKEHGTTDVTIAESVLFTLSNLGYPNKDNQTKMRIAGICCPLVDILKTHAKVYGVVQEACLCLRNLTHDHPDTQTELRTTTNICEILISFNTKYQQQQHRNQKWDHLTEMIRWVWYAIASLVLDSQNRDKLLHCGLSESLVNILKMSSLEDEEFTCYWVCYTLAKIAQDIDCSRALGNIGITRGIVICSEKFVSNESICSLLCQAIGYMANTPENRIWLGAAGTCECLVAMLSKNSASKELCHYALWAISNLVINHVGNLNKIGISGGCQLIPRIVLKYISVSSTIAEWGTKAICNLSVTSENALRLGSYGACDALAYAMLKYLENQEIIEWGCKAIIHLASPAAPSSPAGPAAGAAPGALGSAAPGSGAGGATGSLNPNWIKFRSSLISEALDSALITHLSHTHLLDWCCLAIIEISYDSVMRTKLGTSSLCEGILEILSFYSDNELLSERACGVIRGLSKENPNNLMTLGKAGVCDLLVATMQCHAGNSLIMTSSLEAMSYLAENEFNRAKFGGSGACETVTGLLNHHSENMAVVCASCQAISWLAYENEFNITRLGTSHACEAVTHALTTFLSEPLIAEYGCRAISNLSGDVENQIRFGKCNACEMIIGIFDLHLLNPLVMFQFAMAIGSLVFHYSLNEIKLGALGICDLLTRTLRQHPHNVPIAWSCCRAFHCLSTQSDSLEKEGACLATIEAIKNHSKNEEVCEWGCRAISSMAIDQKNRDALVSYGACEVAIMSLQIGTGSSDALVAVVLQKAIGNVTLALAACDAVHSLGIANDNYRDRLGAGGVCEALARALQKYAENETMAYKGCQVIVTLAEENYSNRSKLGIAGACKSILMSLELHRTSQPVATWGCRAVEIMVDGHEANIARMGSAGVCDAIAIAMQTHQGIPEVAGAGCGAVASLALYDKNTLKLSVAGACEAVVSAVQRHSQEKIIAVKGFAALANLALNPGNSGWLGPAGACEALMTAIQFHLKDEEVAHLAWRAVANLTGEEGNIARLGSCGGCECLLEAMRIHIANEVAIEQCCRALSGLAKDQNNIAMLIQAKVCETVVIVLQIHESSPRVCAEAYNAIFELASRGEAIQLAFLAEGCCTAVTSTLSVHGSTLDHTSPASSSVSSSASSSAASPMPPPVSAAVLTMNGFTAIQALSFNNLDTQKTLGQADACDLVANLIQTHLKSEEVVAEGLVALRCLMDGNLLNIHRLSGSYLCSLLCTVFQKHTRNIRVVINACYVIYHLTVTAPPPSPPPLQSQAQAQSQQQLLSSSSSSSPAEDSSEAGAGETAAAAGGGAGEADDSESLQLTILRDVNGNRTELLEKGIAHIINNSLNKHTTNAELVTISCLASCNLALTPHNDGRFRFGGVGICSVIAKAFQIHLENVTVCLSICRFLRTLCEHYEPIQSKLNSQGMIFRLLVSSLQAYYLREDYAEEGCLAMIALVESHESNRMKLVSAGAIDIVSIVLQTHNPTNQHIATLAMRTLTILGGLR